MSKSWYSVRCVLEVSQPDASGVRRYEERITLWRAESFEEAEQLAEAEAREYLSDIDVDEEGFLGLVQTFWLFGEPEHGGEVFSLIRSSDLEPDSYLSAHFDTGGEHVRGNS